MIYVVTGPQGSGKSSLAARLARGLSKTYYGGSEWVGPFRLGNLLSPNTPDTLIVEYDGAVLDFSNDAVSAAVHSFHANADSLIEANRKGKLPECVPTPDLILVTEAYRGVKPDYVKEAACLK